MSRKLWLVVLAALFLPGGLYAADVSSLATETRYDLNATGGIKSIPANEIRRIPDMIKEPKAQVGMWVPMYEPEPIVRTMNNTLASNTRVFKNTGSQADQFPYLIKVVANREGKNDPVGKWFVYKDVKYNWTFEDAGDDEKKQGGGKNGASGGSVWTPFYKASGAENAVDYMKNFATGKGEPTWDPKVYPNSHMKPFDSGISGTADTKGSTVLQEVGMLMTYEVAEAQVSGESGAGYFGNADLEVVDPSAIPEAKLTSVGSFEKKTLRNPKPDGWKGEDLTAYNRVYVEDYTPPNVRDTKVRIYGGNAGTAVDRVYDDGQWKEVNGIKYEYEDDNPNAAASSDRLQASMNYTCGNMDLFRLDNPQYNPDDPNSEPFVYFTYLSPVTSKDGKTYGPYVGIAKKAEEAYYYKNLDPFWKEKNPKIVEEYVKNRYANAYMGRSLPAHYRGLVYYIIDERQSGLLKIKNLNGSSENSGPEMDALISEYKGSGTRGAAAAADIAAFKAYHASNPPGGLYRYAYIEFKDGGRYCVGPINFEKGNYTEKVVGAGSSEVKQGTWYIDNARILLPKHFAINSMEWNDGDTNVKPGDGISESAKSVKMNKDGTYDKSGVKEDADSDAKTAAAAMPTNSAEAQKRYGEGWMQKVPDLFYKVDAADCCGNNTNQIGFIKVFDDGVGTKPLTEITISDGRSQCDHTVAVPNDESLESGQQLVVKDASSGQSQSYDGGKYDGDYDLTKKEISVSGSGSNVAPIASSLQLADKDKVIYEDVRLNISANAYDNIDKFMKYQGISKVAFKIAELDATGNPTGKYEDLENDKNDPSMRWDEATKALVKEYDNTDTWTPAMKFYHIFRNPGNYKVEYTASDMPVGGKANTQYMAFKVVVRNQTQDIRTIDTDQNRQ